MIFEPIPDHATPRKCGVCMREATLTGYNRSQMGGLDRSSKRFLCEEHSALYAEPISPSIAIQ